MGMVKARSESRRRLDGTVPEDESQRQTDITDLVKVGRTRGGNAVYDRADFEVGENEPKLALMAAVWLLVYIVKASNR
jgi:hypothetical protein